MGDDDDDAPSLQEPLLLVPESSTTPAKAAAQPDTFWPCVMNLAKVITGAGMMAIPRALWLIGWAPATLIMVGVAALTCFTLAVLVQGSASTQAGTYAELVYRTCGRSLARLLQLAVLLFCFGFSVVYLVVIRDILLGEPPECNGLLCEAFGPSANIDARLLIIAVAVLLCAPLLTIRSMDRLSVLNAAGVAATVLLALAAAALAAVAAASGQAHAVPMLPQWDMLGATRGQQWEALAEVLPVILACFVAHQSLHPLMPLLRPYSPNRMLQVVAAALSIACAIFLLLSVGATIAFGPSTDVNVLSNFSIEGLEPLLGWYTAAVLSWAVRGGYLVCILATLLLYMHPLRSCLAQMLWPEPDRPSSHTAGPDIATASSDNEQQQSQQQPQQSPHPESSSVMAPERRLWQDLEQAVYYPLTYGLLAGIVLAAVAVTNIYQAVSFVGDIASTVQAFIVPGVLAIALVVQQRGQIRAAAAAAAAAFMPVDVERGGPAGVSTDSPAPSFKVSVPVGSVLYAAAGAFVLVLGLALFSNGVYERVDDWL